MRPGHRLTFPLVAVLVTAATVACTAPEPVPAAPDPTYPIAPREVRPDEQPLRADGKDGDTAFAVIGLTTGMKALLGSHAEWPADESFLRLRVVVTNNGTSTVTFDARRQRLILSDGTTHRPDTEAMRIKRQPDTISLGQRVRVEFDLYFDVPADAEPKALRAYGGATLTDAKDREGTDIPLG